MGVDAFFTMNVKSGEKKISIQRNGNIKNFTNRWEKLAADCEWFIEGIFEEYSCEVEAECLDGESKKILDAWSVVNGKKTWLKDPTQVEHDTKNVIFVFEFQYENLVSPRFSFSGFEDSEMEEILCVFCDSFYTQYKHAIVKVWINNSIRIFDMAASEIELSSLTADQKEKYGI